MSQTKRASNVKRSNKVASVLGLAGVSLVASAGASTAGIPFQDMAPLQAVTLGDEEIFDVSLATFNVFDEQPGAMQRSFIQLAARGGCARGGCGHGGCGHGGCRGGCAHGGCRGGCAHGGCGIGGCGRGCGGCGCGIGGCGCAGGGGCCLSWGGCWPTC